MFFTLAFLQIAIHSFIHISLLLYYRCRLPLWSNCCFLIHSFTRAFIFLHCCITVVSVSYLPWKTTYRLGRLQFIHSHFFTVILPLSSSMQTPCNLLIHSFIHYYSFMFLHCCVTVISLHCDQIVNEWAQIHKSPNNQPNSEMCV